jgi:hypothetical protein
MNVSRCLTRSPTLQRDSGVQPMQRNVATEPAAVFRQCLVFGRDPLQ